MTRLTRREAIAGIATTLTTVGGVGAPMAEPSAIPETDHETDYPRCVYQPTDDGGWRVSMPINMHVAVPGDRRALSAIEDEFTGLENVRWTRLFPDAEARAWDGDGGELVAPDVSVRRPRLGDGRNHVHVWAVDADRVAVHSHLDVIDIEYDHFHRGDHYDAAVRQVREHLSANEWRRETPYRIEYGVGEGKRKGWGETGDTRLEYVGGD